MNVAAVSLLKQTRDKRDEDAVSYGNSRAHFLEMAESFRLKEVEALKEARDFDRALELLGDG